MKSAPPEERLEQLAAWIPFADALADAGVSEPFARRMIEVGASITLESRPGTGLVTDSDVLAAIASVAPRAVQEHRAVKRAAAALEKAGKAQRDAVDMVAVLRAEIAAAKRAATADTGEKSVADAQRLAGKFAAVEVGAEIAKGRVGEARRELGKAFQAAAADVEAAEQERADKAARAWMRGLRAAESAYREYADAGYELRRLGRFAPTATLIPAGDFATVLERNRDGHVARLAAEHGVA